MKYFFIFCLTIFAYNVQAQSDTISIMSYNLLNFPNGRTDCGGTAVPQRYDTLRKILGYSKPDIFVACEIQTEAGADSILTRSLNVFGATNYLSATYHENTIGVQDLHNMLYYNSDKLVLQWQDVIPTSVRDIDHYVLYAKDPNLGTFYDTTFYEVYMCHLKAGSTTANQTQRDEQVTLLRDYIDSRPSNRNHFVCGDLNVYRSSEPAYQTLISGGITPLKDPINTPGSWNNSGTYASVHTQSTRTTTSYDCGSSGGSDDRFDQILVSQSVLNGSDSVKYITGSYDAVGNDGNHFNSSLISAPTNLQYPDSIVKALYYMSDHLPVYLETVVTYPTSNGLALNPAISAVSCFGFNDGSITIQPNAGQGPYEYAWGASAGNQTTQTAINLPAGEHCVIVTDDLGEVDDICVVLGQPNEIQVGTFTSSSAGMVCNGIAYALAGGGVPDYTYLWNDPLAQTTSSATDLCPGDYSVLVEDATGCQVTIEYTIIDNTIGIDELSSDNFLVSPNPFSSQIQINTDYTLSNVSYTIVDVEGRILISTKIDAVNSGKEVVLSTEELSSGSYFLTISGDSFKVTKHLIK